MDSIDRWRFVVNMQFEYVKVGNDCCTKEKIVKQLFYVMTEYVRLKKGTNSEQNFKINYKSYI